MNIECKQAGTLSTLADLLMVPFMYLASGTIREAPQETHAWNNERLRSDFINNLSKENMVSCAGDPSAISHIPLLFHIPILGGWRKYVVLSPRFTYKEWFVGWVAGDFIRISCIPLTGPVRVLIGQGKVKFFAVGPVSTNDNDDSVYRQFHLERIGSGRIGEGGPYARYPLR